MAQQGHLPTAPRQIKRPQRGSPPAGGSAIRTSDPGLRTQDSYSNIQHLVSNIHPPLPRQTSPFPRARSGPIFTHGLSTSILLPSSPSILREGATRLSRLRPAEGGGQRRGSVGGECSMGPRHRRGGPTLPDGRGYPYPRGVGQPFLTGEVAQK